MRTPRLARLPGWAPILLLAGAFAASAAHAAGALGFDDARHLLNRTGFAAGAEEIRAFAGLTRGEAVDRLLGGTRTATVTAPPAWTGEPFQSPRRLRAMSAEERKLALAETFQRAF